MTRHQKLKQIIKMIIENEEKILKVRGGRGYGVGHPILNKGKVSDHLGKEDEQQKVQQSKKPVRISKAFKNKKRI